MKCNINICINYEIQMTVGVFMFLFFCCLGFSVVICFAVRAGGCVFHFLLFGRGHGPRPNSKKKNLPAQTAKKNKHAPAPSERVFPFLFAVWAGGRAYFVCLGGGASFFAVWAGRGVGTCFFFCCLGGCVFLFCCLGGCRVFFWLLGGGARARVCVFFFVVVMFGQVTGVHSLTGLLGSSLSDPTTKKTKQQKKKKKRVPFK